MMRKCLLAASPHYPGFEQEVMKRNINELCDLAKKSAYNERVYWYKIFGWTIKMRVRDYG